MTPESYLPVSWRPKKISEDGTEMEAPEPLPVKKITAMDGVPEEPTELEKFLGVSAGPMKVAEAAPSPSQNPFLKKLQDLEFLKLKQAAKKAKEIGRGPGGDTVGSNLAESIFGPGMGRSLKLSEEETKNLAKLESSPEIKQDIEKYLTSRGLGKYLTGIRSAQRGVATTTPMTYLGNLPRKFIF